MKILEVIDRVDALYPNTYTQSEKIRWCDEVNAVISREMAEKYDMLECTARENEEIVLPDGIDFDDIDSVYVDGIKLDKTDLRSYGMFPSDYGIMPCSNFGKIRIVYLLSPNHIRNIDITGEFNVSEDFIEMSLPHFKTGDAVDITTEFNSEDEPYYKAAERYYVCNADENGIYLDRSPSFGGDNVKIAICRVITDSTAAPPPYDVMYIEYILAKMAHYQHDYDTYKACRSQFNTWLNDFLKYYKNRNALNRPGRFRRLW